MNVQSYKIGEYVRVIDDCFNKDHLNIFLRICDKIEFKESRVGEGRVDKNIRTAEVYDFHKFSKKLTEVHWNNYFCFHINNLVRKYFMPLLKIREVKSAIDFQLLKYTEGGFYEMHVDHSLTSPRNISVIIFLNDDYEGGELEFFSPDGVHSQKVKPKKGRTVIWPSNFLYPHKANPVTKGTRYAIVCWLQ